MPVNVTFNGGTTIGTVVQAETVTIDQTTRREAGPDAGPVARLKFLYLAANSPDTARVALDEEARVLRQKLELARAELVMGWAVRPGEVPAYLHQRPNVVMFSGHGTPDGDLLFAHGDGGSAEVSADALRAAFASAPRRVEVVVLNACYSELLAAALCTAVDVVIGMSDEIEDRAAAAFAGALCEGLAQGCTIAQAFGQALAVLDLERHPGVAVPRLHVAAGGSADRMLRAHQGGDHGGR